MESFTVEFTQFMRPDGREKTVNTTLPVSAKEAYQEMLVADCRLEIEVLQNGAVSATISNGDEDIDCILRANGPGLQKAIANMIERRAWVKQES